MKHARKKKRCTCCGTMQARRLCVVCATVRRRSTALLRNGPLIDGSSERVARYVATVDNHLSLLEDKPAETARLVQ